MSHRIKAKSGMSLAAVTSALVLSGCVRETQNGDVTTYTNELWVPLVVLLGGIAAGVVGIVFRQPLRRFAWVLIVLGPVAAVGFAPSLFLDKATVSPDRFTLRAGIWGLTAVHDINLDNLQLVRLTSETRSGRRGRSTSYYLICDSRDGSSAKIALGNKVAEAASLRLLQAAKDRGVPINDETGG